MADPHETEGGTELWLEYISVETPLGRTFDPVQYLVAACRTDPDVQGTDDDWQEFYANDPTILGHHLLDIACSGTMPEDDRESAIEACIRIAETLPVDNADGIDAYGSKNEMLSRICWAAIQQKDIDLAVRVFEMGQNDFAAESLYYLADAVRKLTDEPRAD